MTSWGLRITLLGALALLACKQERGRDGARCDYAYDCATGLTCVESTKRCRAYEHPEAMAETEAARRRLAEAKAVKEREMLAQSGVTPAAEQVAAPSGPAPAGAIRVSRAKGQTEAFAACRGDERLVGGGCSTAAQVERSAPDAYGETDTLGARWTCRATAPYDVEAYALCARLTAAAPEPNPGSPPDAGAPAP